MHCVPVFDKIFQTEKQLVEFGDKLEELDKSRLENIIKELKTVCDGEDMVGVEDLTEKLNETWQEISGKLYQDTNDPDPDPTKDEVTDVDYEEVK